MSSINSHGLSSEVSLQESEMYTASENSSQLSSEARNRDAGNTRSTNRVNSNSSLDAGSDSASINTARAAAHQEIEPSRSVITGSKSKKPEKAIHQSENLDPEKNSVDTVDNIGEPTSDPTKNDTTDGDNSVNENTHENYEVQFHDHDLENPRLMSKARKWFIVLMLTMVAIEYTSLSSCWSVCVQDIKEQFDTTSEIAVVGIAVYVFGLGLGPLIFAPLSEFYGRKPIYTFSLILFVAFQFPVAFAQNIQTALIGRFLSSFFGSAFMSNVAGTISDMFVQSEMKLPLGLFTLGPFMGPSIGPIIGGFIVNSVTWRWLFYVYIIWGGISAILLPILIPETYPPILLKKKAQRLRESTGDDKYYAPFEKKDTNLLVTVKENCVRPVVLMTQHPMLALLCFYTGYLLAVVYMFFVAFPMVYEQIYGFTIQYVGLSFVPIAIGNCCAFSMVPLLNRVQTRMLAKNNGVWEPEMILPAMCLGAVICPMGLFIFAWTVYSNVHWIGSMIGAGTFSCGTFFMFNSIQSYTAVVYKKYAASALAANVLTRAMMAGAFPLFTRQMLTAMGFHWGISFVGFVTMALAPAAYMLLIYGRQIRLKTIDNL